MNENLPMGSETSVITSVSQSSHTSDVIDLIEINDSDEHEITSNCTVIVPNNSVRPQQQGSRPARNRRRKNNNSSEDNPSTKGSADDSICILYENIKPPPEVVVVNEVIIDHSGPEGTPNNDSNSIQIPPFVLGAPLGDPELLFPQISSLFPDISNERTSQLNAGSYQPIDYSLDSQLRPTQYPNATDLPSCKYANTTERPSQPSSVVEPGLQRLPLNRMQGVLNLKTVPSNSSNHASGLEKTDIVIKTPKIQCGICLDGPDEIAASDRNFTSTNCGHVFCNTCIKTSMRSAAKCPKCRKKITARSIHPLYF